MHNICTVIEPVLIDLKIDRFYILLIRLSTLDRNFFFKSSPAYCSKMYNIFPILSRKNIDFVLIVNAFHG